MNRPLVLLGLPGSGKTFWGKKLATHLNIPFYDLDELIVQEAGLTIKEIFDEGGESLFRSIESSTLFNICQAKIQDNYILALGGGTPAFNNNMERVNTSCTSVFLDVSISTVVHNLEHDKGNHRPLLEQADKKLLTTLLEKLRSERILAYNQANYLLYEEEISIANFEKIITDAQ